MSRVELVEALLADMDRIVRRFDGGGGDPAAVNALRAQLAPIKEQVAALLTSLRTDEQLVGLAAVLADFFARQSSPREFANAALEAILPVMKASRGWVATVDEDASEAVLIAEMGPGTPSPDAESRLSRSLLAELVKTKEPLLINDAREGPHGEQTSVVRMRLRSILLAPLVTLGRVTGAIGVENTTLAGAFTEDDKRRLMAIAGLLTPCLQVGRRLHAVMEERERLTEALAEGRHREIVGTSEPIRALLATIEKIKDSDVPVLVEGESGTGKELVARALHFSSRRAAGPLVTVNCAAIPEGLIESELLGHERGAFTGASDRKRGKFEQAHGGTLFLDEMGELKPELQAKLLRVLQERAFERVGGGETIRVDVRLVAATNRSLKQLVSEGRFREDLFYRLYVVPLRVPPLRDRPEDIVPLTRHFLDELCRTSGKSLSFEPAALEALQRHRFPGNVRELRNLVHRLVVLADADVITEAELPDEVTGRQPTSTEKDPFRRFLKRRPITAPELRALRGEMQAAFDAYVREMERSFYAQLLERAGGNVSEAARLAGMNRTALHRKLGEIRPTED